MVPLSVSSNDNRSFDAGRAKSILHGLLARWITDHRELSELERAMLLSEVAATEIASLLKAARRKCDP